MFHYFVSFVTFLKTLFLENNNFMNISLTNHLAADLDRAVVHCGHKTLRLSLEGSSAAVLDSRHNLACKWAVLLLKVGDFAVILFVRRY